MSNRVLLIAPYIHDFAAYDLWLKPLGLLYLAAAVDKAGYEVRLVNCLDRLHPSASSVGGANRSRTDGCGRGKFSYEPIPKPKCLADVPRRYKRYGIPLEAFRRQLSEGPPPDAIGVGSMMTYWYGGVAETVEVAREVFPDVPVILGGVYATLCAEHAREHVGADAVVEGPGETKFIEILRRSVGDGEEVRPDSLRPAYHLLGNLDSVSMLTSFGCPFSCAYCASKLLRRGFLQRPVKDVVDEIVWYAREMRINDIAFYDDALLANPDQHIKPILREIIGKGLQLRLHTPNGLHANMIDRELAALMKAAGFASVRLSIESVHEVRLKDSCAKVTPEGFTAAMSNLFSAGFAPGSIEAYVLMGAPGQRPEEVEETMRFAHENGGAIRLADFSPIPGTGYFDAAVETYGLDPAEPLLQNSSALPHIVPGLLDQYQKLKTLARSLNSQLAARSPAERA
jgi:radical SAM superfamily enzyme YgiQ (UPF0313 family)